MNGKLAGIARHQLAKGPMEPIHSASVTIAAGVAGDYRGTLAAKKPGRKRQVSIIEAGCWAAATAEAGVAMEWWHSRRNLLVDGLRIPRKPGTRVAVGSSLVLEVTGECDPCDRMDGLFQGLRGAMTPDWRGGFTARVIDDGDVAIGDEVRII